MAYIMYEVSAHGINPTGMFTIAIVIFVAMVLETLALLSNSLPSNTLLQTKIFPSCN